MRRTAAIALAIATVAAMSGTSAVAAVSNGIASDFTNEQKLRRELGFSNDSAVLSTLRERAEGGADVHSGVLGIPLSDEEFQELAVRDELGRVDAPAVIDVFRERSDFGGLFIDNLHDGRLHVLTTGDPIAVDAVLRARVRRPDRLWVTHVDSTFAELLGAQAAIGRQVSGWHHLGIDVTGVGIDQPRNSVRVALTADTAEHRAAVIAAVPPGINTVFIERQADSLLGGNVQNSLPFRGGQSIRDAGYTTAPGYDCSLGFVAYATLSNGSKSPSVITAGHCGFSGSTWYQYNQYMGVSTNNTYPYYGGATYADSMRIPISQGVSNDFLAANYEVYNISGWEGQYDGPVGQTVCNNGASSYRVCGTLTDNNYTDYKYFDDGTVARFDYVRVTTATARRGDSGAAITHTAGLHYASGTLRSGLCPNVPDPVCTEMKYIHIYNALRALHLDGVYTA